MLAGPEPADAPSVGSHVRWWRYEGAIALALTASLVWLAQFHHFRDFGLYEDDYFFVSEAMGKDPSYLLARFTTAFTRLPQGRPLGFFLPDLFSFIGDKLGGLAAIYVLGFMVVTLNTVLCYWLLRARRLPVGPAAVGATVFCLFAADTTKILLTHDFQLQPSLTFALVSALAYVRGWRVLASVVSAGALLSYENGFLALFALPLFAYRWDRRMPRRLVTHVLILVGVVACVVALRFSVGEGRATTSAGSLTQILPPLLGSLVLGPLRSLGGMLYGPAKAVETWDVETAICVVVAIVGSVVILRSTLPRTVEHRAALQVAAAGLVMLVLGYGLAFTHFPPNALVGRGTSVHLGATLGMAVLAAGVAWLVLGSRYARVWVVVIAAYIGLAVGYYVTIQRDFMRSWQLQRAFWQQVAACCSDLADGTVLIYQVSPSDEPTFIFTNSWADPLVLGETFAFPSSWATVPRLFSLTEWQDRVQADSAGGLRWWVPGASWDEHWESLPQDNVIVLTGSSDGRLMRETGDVRVSGEELRLKQPGAAIHWPSAQLYDPLLR